MNKCENCGAEFDNALDINSSRFCCEHCRRVWIGKTSTTRHIKEGTFVSPFKTWNRQNHAPYGTWKCPHCEFIGETKRFLRNHIKEKHSEFCGNNSWNKGLTKETSPEVAKNSAAIKATMNTPESREKRSKIQKVCWTEGRRKAKSEEKKKLYAEHPEKHPNRKLANNRKKISYPEQIAFDWLTEHKIIFEHQKQIGHFFADFYIPSINSIIEIDGTHWHNSEKDKLRDKEILDNFGIKTIRISTKEQIKDRLSIIFNVNI